MSAVESYLCAFSVLSRSYSQVHKNNVVNAVVQNGKLHKDHN